MLYLDLPILKLNFHFLSFVFAWILASLVKPADEDMSMLIILNASVLSICASAFEAFGFWIIWPRFDFLKFISVFVLQRVATGDAWRFIVC